MVAILNDTIRELDRADIDAVLGRNIIGRLAYLREGRIDVVPVNYVYWNGAIFGRTSAGGKLAHLQEGTDVSFEVDEIRAARDWRSVLVHGTFHVASQENGDEAWMRALGIVRRVQKQALRREDPFPDRTRIFRIFIDDVTGRAMG